MKYKVLSWLCLNKLLYGYQIHRLGKFKMFERKVKGEKMSEGFQLKMMTTGIPTNFEVEIKIL
jgi:hypothetical protein